ncbi:MAG: alpha/beta fold hydrolase [Acidobacteria bacterium]|nr:alpha/beta fold hydrolase [Acidobacteriota bacterium]
MRGIYLHGFASSARSSKARTFADRLAPYDIVLEALDFNQPSFETLTITRMIEHAVRAIDGGSEPVALIGSSLGAFVAVHVAAQRAAVEKLVLLAPALDFAETRMRDLGDDAIARWRETGLLDVFHYGFGRLAQVGYALYEDAARYDAFGLELTQPMLVFQGTRDAVVNPAVARKFASTRTNVTLRLLDDDHQLLSSMPDIWEETRVFLGLPARP